MLAMMTTMPMTQQGVGSGRGLLAATAAGNLTVFLRPQDRDMAVNAGLLAGSAPIATAFFEGV